MKRYTDDIEGKREFVEEVVSPLLVQANTGWGGCRYVATNGAEEIYFITPDGFVSDLVISVKMDSLEAIVRDVFRAI